MPMWSGYWGGPWAAFGWVFPLIGLLFMVVMVVLGVRMMGRMGRGGCVPYGGYASGEPEDLRRDVRELREEIRKLREEK